MKTSDEQYDLLMRIRNRCGVLSKRNLLHSDLKPVLNYALDPFKRFYIQNIYTVGTGTKQFEEKTWFLLDLLKNRELTGHAAISTVAEHLMELTPKSAELFKIILSKKLRIGMGAKSVNKVYPGLIPVHPLMLAKQYDESKVRLPCFVSLKKDGVRSIGDDKFYSRGGHEYIGLEHLREQLPIHKLDGELVVPGKTFYDSSGLIRSDNVTPTAEFWVFDMPDVQKPFHERLMILEDLVYDLPNIHLIKHVLVRKLSTIWEYYAAVRKQGEEGLVIKYLNYFYKDTRCYDWMKVVAKEGVDLEVESIYEAEGLHRGMLGGMHAKYLGCPVKIAPGRMTHEDRKFYFEHPYEIEGRTVEVYYKEKTPDGSLREPRFSQFRDDLD